MSWPVAFVFGYVLLAIELVLPRELQIGPTAIAPSFVVPFVVYIAMFAPAITAYWAAIFLGLTFDLTTPRGENAAIVAGPYALGLLAATFLIVTLRTIINRNPLALIVFSIVASAFCGLVIVAIFTIRSWYTPQMSWFAAGQLSQRLFSAVYTGATAAVLSLVLFPAYKLFKFQDPYSRRATFRPY